jgi:hypothetical protein
MVKSHLLYRPFGSEPNALPHRIKAGWVFHTHQPVIILAFTVKPSYFNNPNPKNDQGQDFFQKQKY